MVNLLNQLAPPPLVDLVPIDRLLKPFLKSYLRLPAQTMNLVTTQRISEVAAWSVGDGLHHSL